MPTASFYRGYDGADYRDMGYPAQVSDFVLDTYEVTVGRFRNFVAVYAQGMTVAGAGKNPNNPSDTGWDPNWNGDLPTNASTLRAALKCYGPYQTWTDSPGNAAAESRPINCLDWNEAEAFCIWDGGRLPTEAEWNYAAAGGTEQRRYPWGPFDPEPNAELAVYKCYYPGVQTCAGVLNIAPVGSVPAGNGKWGQADLAGNVWEWAQDVYVSPYPNPCNDCANLAASGRRTLLSGGFNYLVTSLLSAARTNAPQLYRDHGTGVRCARGR